MKPYILKEDEPLEDWVHNWVDPVEISEILAKEDEELAAYHNELAANIVAECMEVGKSEDGAYHTDEYTSALYHIAQWEICRRGRFSIAGFY